MTELTVAEQAAIIAGPGRWERITNWFKNLSWLWSPKERALQRELNHMFDSVVVEDRGNIDWGEEEDHCIVAEPPKMFPDQPNGYLG